MRAALNSGSDAPGAPPILNLLGALGVVPFWAPVLAALAWPQERAVAVDALAAYAAVILSFLAGARMGMAIVEDRPSVSTLCVSMAPPVLAWLLVLLPLGPATRLVLLALALLAHAVWDARACFTPVWYGRLRWRLTLGALVGLISGAVVLNG